MFSILLQYFPVLRYFTVNNDVGDYQQQDDFLD